MKKFYVYKHLTADINEVFYVGKGLSKRVKSIKRNPKHTNVVKKHGIIVEVVLETDNEQEALQKEIELIAECHTFVNDPLADYLASNLTLGGEGPSGAVRSEETRAKMRDAHTGFKHNDETKAKISDAQIAACNTPEVRMQKSESQKQRRARERAERAADPHKMYNYKIKRAERDRKCWEIRRLKKLQKLSLNSTESTERSNEQ